MKDDDIDRILTEQDDLEPSSGFAESVMSEVVREASVPLPIPFPWARAIPGVAAAGVTVAWLVVEIVAPADAGGALAENASNSSTVVDVMMAAAASPGTRWVAAALILTLASVSLSMRLGSRGA